MCFVGIIKHCYCYRGLLFSQQDGLNPTSTNILNEFPLVLSHLFFFLFSLNEKDILLLKSSDVLILMQL